MNGQPTGERETGLVPSDSSPIDVMCEVTGGRSYCITSHRMLHQCIDSLVQKIQAGVVIHFEKYGPDPTPLAIVDGTHFVLYYFIFSFQKLFNEHHACAIIFHKLLSNTMLYVYFHSCMCTVIGLKLEDDMEIVEEKNGFSKPSWHSSRKMIYVPRSSQKGFAGGFWPIPESFWPEPALPGLPARTAHPNVRFTCHPADPLVIENFPFDKYELEPSPLTQYILARKQPTVCWQVIIVKFCHVS